MTWEEWWSGGRVPVQGATLQGLVKYAWNVPWCYVPEPFTSRVYQHVRSVLVPPNVSSFPEFHDGGQLAPVDFSPEGLSYQTTSAAATTISFCVSTYVDVQRMRRVTMLGRWIWTCYSLNRRLDIGQGYTLESDHISRL